MSIIESASAGDVIGLSGMDKYLSRFGTISSIEGAHPFIGMKFAVSPVVSVAVTPKKISDMEKFTSALRKLQAADPMVVIRNDEHTGETVIYGAGELHLEICLKDLSQSFMGDAELNVSEPLVKYCESITTESSMQIIAKSPNKLNRLYCSSAPVDERLVQALEKGDLDTRDSKAFAKTLCEEFGWDLEDAKRVLYVDSTAGNFLVNHTKSNQYLTQIKDNLISAFKTLSGGVLCEEPIRGVCIYIEDAVIHMDAAHRGPGQIIPAAKKAFMGCMLVSGPAILEPVFLVNISVPGDKVSGVYNSLSKRRGVVTKVEGTGMTVIEATLPVKESFGFTSLLRAETSGEAFPQMTFSHWERSSGDPLEDDSVSNTIVHEIRKRKGLKADVPPLSDFHSKI
jgi:elongation factor 2